MDNQLYQEYLEHLVVEVEGKVGVMPPCLLKPLSNEPAPELLSPISSPYNSQRMSAVEEDTCITPKARHHQKDLEKDVDTVEGVQEKFDDMKHDSHTGVTQTSWKVRLDAFERKLQHLKNSMVELRSQDTSLVRQFLSVNDSIEELKWLNENTELYDSSNKDTTSRSLFRHDSREQLHERWLSERRLQSTSRTGLNNSFTNLSSTSLSRLNQNNNSNAIAWNTSPNAGEESTRFHPRSMSTSATESSETVTPLRHRPFSSVELIQTMDRAPVTSTPKIEPNNREEEPNVSRDMSSVDSNQVSRVQIGSYGSQVRWLYNQTAEEEYYL